MDCSYVRIMVFSRFYFGDFTDKTVIILHSVHVRILVECSENCQSGKIYSPPKFPDIYVW